MANKQGYILALDVGEKRIGAALASAIARLPSPYTTLHNDETVFDEISTIITKENVATVVVGLPRSLSGKESTQTAYSRDFAEKIRKLGGVEVYLQDEALTSKKAESELRARKEVYSKGDVDALAATYILSDFLATIDAMERRI